MIRITNNVVSFSPVNEYLGAQNDQRSKRANACQRQSARSAILFDDLQHLSLAMNDGHALKRALVVEDYEPFRRFLCSILRERADIQVIVEESDGIEAVKKAQELEPDLVILVMGLPGGG